MEGSDADMYKIYDLNMSDFIINWQDKLPIFNKISLISSGYACLYVEFSLVCPQKTDILRKICIIKNMEFELFRRQIKTEVSTSATSPRNPHETV